MWRLFASRYAISLGPLPPLLPRSLRSTTDTRIAPQDWISSFACVLACALSQMVDKAYDELDAFNAAKKSALYESVAREKAEDSSRLAAQLEHEAAMEGEVDSDRTTSAGRFSSSTQYSPPRDLISYMRRSLFISEKACSKGVLVLTGRSRLSPPSSYRAALSSLIRPRGCGKAHDARGDSALC